MPKTRRPRLSWFRFYADDFLGGSGAFTSSEVGQYVLLLLQQWASGVRQAVPSEPERLRIICRGEPSVAVLAKFEVCRDGLRNRRLAEEWTQAHEEYQGKARHGMTADTAQRVCGIGNVPKTLWQRILDRDSHQCVRCHSTSDLTVDHVIPTVLGGADTEDNLQTLCRSCNSKRPVDPSGVEADLKEWGLSQQIPSGKAAVSTQKGPPTKSQEPRTKNVPFPAALRASGESEAIPQPVVVDDSVVQAVPQSVGDGAADDEVDDSAIELRLVGVRSETDAVRTVFDYWRVKTGEFLYGKTRRAVWNDQRRTALRSRVREEPGDLDAKVRGLCMVVDGALKDALFNGTEKGTPYLDFENLFVHGGRNRIEKLQGVALRGGPKAPQSERSRQMLDSMKAGVLGGMK